MDGLPPGVGSRSAHSSHHNSSHGRHRGYMPNDAASLLPSSMPFMMPSYPMMVMPGGAQPSCAEAGVLSPAYRQGVDRGRAPPSYAENAYKSNSFAVSTARHSPSRSSLPPSSDHRAAASLQLRGSTDPYSAPAPVSQLSGRSAPAAEVSYPQYQEPPLPQKQAGPPEPPKKPLSPYMRFSKSVSSFHFFYQLHKQMVWPYDYDYLKTVANMCSSCALRLRSDYILVRLSFGKITYFLMG